MFRNSFAYLLAIVCFLGYSCHKEDREKKIEIPLNSTWEFRKLGSNTWYPAHVPGSLASDIAQINNKEKSFIIDGSKTHKGSWEYSTTFDVADNILRQDVVQLCFKGLAANADVYLNDSLLLKANNRFRPWTVNCKSRLKAKGNQLKVFFHHASRRKAWHHKHHTILDSCPKEQSSADENSEVLDYPIGIWRPVCLQAWSVALINDLNLRPDSIAQKKAIYSANLSITSVVDQDVYLELLINDKPTGKPLPISLKKGNNAFQTKITIDKPKFWWTNGLGNPSLYNVIARLTKGNTIIQEIRQRLGVRTIELVNHLNLNEHSCYFKLNGIPVFIKGAGFRADNCLFDTARAFYGKAIESAAAANFNTLKVSKREIYDDFFYDLCDEKGILVWQDIQLNSLMAHRDSNYQDNIKQEAIESIKHIRNHPCLALWWIKDDVINMDYCKNNGLDKPGISEKCSICTNKSNPKILDTLIKDYGYPTPYLDDDMISKSKVPIGVELLNGQMIGNMVVNYGVPSDVSLKTINHGIFSLSNSNEISATEFIRKNFNKPENSKDESYMIRIAQSEMMKSLIENHRINMPRCMGSVFEQMNDSKGCMSASALDSSGQWRPAQYAVKDAFSHILVVPVREKNVVNIYAVSDAFKNLDAILLVRLIDFNGNDIFVRQIPVEIESGASGILMSLKESVLLKNVDKSQCCLVVQLNQATKTMSQNILYFTELKNLQLPEPSVDIDVNEVAKGYNIIVKSSVIVKNIFIQTFSRECWFSDNNFDLLPGKRTKIHVRYSGTKNELLKDIRIHSLADLN